MLKHTAFATILFLLAMPAFSQHQDVFPDLEGDELIQALRENYRPTVFLLSSDARDTLFSKIDARNDSLSCVYTGFTIYLDPNEDPTQEAFAKGINTEHTYPQAFGAGQEPARSDMHHLFPTRVNVNAARANLPFLEIPDGQAQSWYYLDQQQSNIPNNNIDSYSEITGAGFEPPEAHKGDVARAMFYFYTVYRAEANAEGPNFFPPQVETLCQWHALDPADEKEWVRTQRIASYQDDKPNPFVLDCSLLARCYCAGIIEPCMPVSATEAPALPSLQLRAFPNPFRDLVRIEYQLGQPARVELILYDAIGSQLAVVRDEWRPAGAHQIEVSRDQLPEGFSGLLLGRLKAWDGKRTLLQTVKLAVLPR